MKIQVLYGILIPFLGTSLGAACVFLMKKAMSDRMQRILTGFAAGVMVAASIWSLLLPAMEQASAMGRWSFVPAVAGFWLGILFLLLLDHLIPHLHRNSRYAEGPRSRLQKTTMLVLAVTLHNIPEGMAVAVPLITGGMKRGKAILITALSGAPTIIGAVIGFALGTLSPFWLSLSLSFASGAMLYVVFGELLPEAILMWRSKMPALASVIGILIGLMIIYI